MVAMKKLFFFVSSLVFTLNLTAEFRFSTPVAYSFDAAAATLLRLISCWLFINNLYLLLLAMLARRVQEKFFFVFVFSIS